MCGIAGIVRFDGRSVDGAIVASMTEQIAHRGPDDQGFWVEGPVGLGHRRLSIIDLEGSPQPMASRDDRLHVVFNGEILNYREVRGRLEYPFRTSGDTETLLAGFNAYGPSFVEQLSGQFAFAIHDRRDRSIWLYRDRLGILPLYYWLDDRQLVFASEIKAMLPALPRRLEVDQRGLGAYLAHRSVPAPRTLFAGVRKLKPGHRLHVTSDGAARIQRWWSVPDLDQVEAVSGHAAVERVSSALRASVERNLVADVPVGSYLSGGVDSSLIVALMTELVGSEKVHTFSAGFADPEFDEVHHALRVSEHLGTIHHEVTVTTDDFERLWPRLTWHRDAPISEPADIAVFRLAELARQHVKVVLSGEGSDELFAGYPKYRFARMGALAGAVPSVLRAGLIDQVERRLPPRLRRARVALRALRGASEAERLEGWFAPFTSTERNALLNSVDRRPGQDIPIGRGDPVRRMLFADCHAWLADNLLERGDRMSMAASLELRPPFLDHKVVELAFSLPSDVKLRKGVTKWVVKEVARSMLPSEIVDRPKAGFRVPIATWLRGSMRDMAYDRLLAPHSFVTEAFNRKVIQQLLESHASGQRNEDIRIWTLLCLEVWHEQFRGHLAGASSDSSGLPAVEHG